MAKAPQVNGAEALGRSKRLGCEEVRTGGKHIIVRGTNGKNVPIPNHGSKTIKTGTLCGTLKQLDITLDDFRNA